MKKILGIDYGDKRIGLALAEQGSIAVPYSILDNDSNILSNLKNIIIKENIDIVVIGLPHSFSGKENERLSITKEFITSLENSLDIPIHTVDEQLTTQLYKKQGIKKDIDKHSATAILDTFLQQNNE